MPTVKKRLKQITLDGATMAAEPADWIVYEQFSTGTGYSRNCHVYRNGHLEVEGKFIVTAAIVTQVGSIYQSNQTHEFALITLPSTLGTMTEITGVQLTPLSPSFGVWPQLYGASIANYNATYRLMSGASRPERDYTMFYRYTGRVTFV